MTATMMKCSAVDMASGTKPPPTLVVTRWPEPQASRQLCKSDAVVVAMMWRSPEPAEAGGTRARRAARDGRGRRAMDAGGERETAADQARGKVSVISVPCP